MTTGDSDDSFTFHYVSIKTEVSNIWKSDIPYLHSTMSLLKLEMMDPPDGGRINLHSTMSLLKQLDFYGYPTRYLIYIPLCLY